MKNPSLNMLTSLKYHRFLAAVAILAGQLSVSVDAADMPGVRIRDIATMAGEHQNDVVGLGIVVGLQGTGGSSDGTKRAAVEILQKVGLRADPQTRAAVQQIREKTDNISVVMVTARLPPHSKPGQRMDVTVAAFDDAESLNGGVLLRTPLRGVDGEVYAIAMGPVSTNGGIFGGDGGSVQKNHPTTGRVPDGAVIEAEVPTEIIHQGHFHLLLRQPNLETASRMVRVINEAVDPSAWVSDPAMVSVRIPTEYAFRPFDFIAMCLKMTVHPDIPAKVVINERNGTVIFTEDVRLAAVAITHGNLVVTTSETPEVSQPAPLSGGQTAIVPRTEISVVEEERMINVIDQTATVSDLAASLNALGVTPRDLSSIFQMLKEAGALHAELELK